VAADLGVRFVVEGSVRQAGQRIRVSVQLADTESGNHLWTQRYDRQLDDIFAIQDEITSAIAGAVAPEIERFEQRRADTAPTTDVDVWLLYQKGQNAANMRSEEKMVEAIEYFDQANRLEPKFVPALASGAIMRMILANIYRGNDLEPLSRVAKQNADLASSIDPSEPLVMLAQSRIFSGLGNHSQAMALARKAVEVNPNNASAHGRAAAAAVISGHFDECLHHSGVLLQLSPLDPFEYVVKSYMAFCYYILGENDKALAAALSANNPKQLNMVHRLMVAMVLLKLEHAEVARASIAEIKVDFPQMSVQSIRKGAENTAPGFLNPFLEGLRELGVPEE
jgi:adenylate cyclase